MSQTMDGIRLKEVRVFGQQLPTSVSEHCLQASMSLSNSQVTQMDFVFADTMGGQLFTSGALSSGVLIDYGGWQLEVDDHTFGPGNIGPTLSIKAPSRLVMKIKRDRGTLNFGTVGVSDWVARIAREFGMKPIVQPGLPVVEIIRGGPTPEQPDAMPESSWDVLARLSNETGCWLYEVKDRLYFGKPSWLASNAMHHIHLYWNNWFDYSPALAQMPTYSGSGAGEKQQLQLQILAPDADEIVPGDVVNLTGQGMGKATGQWIVTSVGFPMNVSGPVTLSCQRISDPAPGAAKAVASGVGAVNYASGNFTGAAFKESISYPQAYKPGTAYEFLMSLFMQQQPVADSSAGAGNLSPAGFAHPAPGSRVSQGYHAGHNGIDLAAPMGTPILAANGGMVVFAGWSSGGGGNEIHINHPNGIQTWYAHNSVLLVKVGQTVKTGQQIARMGSTGNSTGSHLHYMALRGGWPNHINPTPYMGGR